MTNKYVENCIKKIFDANSEKELEEHLKKAQEVGSKIFGKKIHFYAPSFMYYKTSYCCSSPTDFPTISVTGKGCALNCKHCGGKVLNTMYSATTPEKLLELCMQIKRRGALGCLISGGCLPNGSVPLGRFIDTIEKVKRELDLTIIVHTGMVDFNTAEKLRKAGVDAALIDIIGSGETIKVIYRLNLTVKAYEDSLRVLHEAGIPFVPHVIVGLHYGKLKGELNALQMVSRYQPSALVIIAFMPIHGTEMEKVEPPKPVDIAKVMATARLMFPQTPLALGCMRPKGRHRVKTDVLAIKAGVNAIAFPAEEAIRFAEKQGYETTFSSLCCSQVYADFIV
ncbi:MAG: radical SAM protein [Candidatus Bathyarchaeota archaeon]|nr:radical SAM protein [Candidatus Bathyarchaeota archaeon]MDH5746690.1 radical SAM protein [Candidatus Bathyarchaeota archaeon]